MTNKKCMLIISNPGWVHIGYVDPESNLGIIEMENYRNVMYYTGADGGLFGLAVDGPTSSTKLGSLVKSKTKWANVTGLVPLTGKAEKAFKEWLCE